MKIKIISDGTPKGHKVINAETGELVENISSVKVYISPRTPTKALVEFTGVLVDIIAETEEKRASEDKLTHQSPTAR